MNRGCVWIRHIKGIVEFFTTINRPLAYDYLAIPASTCLAERSFSMSAWTDDCRRRQMGSEKFGGLQCLRSAYHDGRLEAVNEAWMEIDPDFGIDE